MKLITAIVQTEKLEDVQRALIKNGIPGMTMTEVYGHGRQRGHVEVYRGAEFTIDFIQKVRIEVLVKDADAERVIAMLVDRAEPRVGKECRSRWSPYH